MDCELVYSERYNIGYTRYKMDVGSLVTGELKGLEIKDVVDIKDIGRYKIKGSSLCESFYKCSTINNEIDVEEVKVPIDNIIEDIKTKHHVMTIK